ncbi:MAG: hypothetical protein IPK26_11755 [Planctomycetes bacterium]|nr:hypothetical protein [Planctomycetota bacterium]
MNRTSTGLIVAAVALLGCRGSRPRMRVEDPDTVQHRRGTGLQAADLRDFAGAIVARLEEVVPGRADGRRVLVRMDRIVNATSQQFDPEIVADAVLAAALQREPRRFELLTERGESIGERLQLEQQGGKRVGSTPPPALPVPDLSLSGTVREHAIQAATELSRYVQFVFQLSTLDGVATASGSVDYQRAEARHPIYQRR